jgi:ferric-dicitrate binding protein FerR (iron transport regulator)
MTMFDDKQHKPASFDRRQLLTGGAALLLMPGIAEAAPAAGKISAITGNAFATRSADRLTLASGNELFVNDTVETGTEARLVAELLGRTTLKLGQSAKIRIDRFLAKRGGVITIEAGAFLFDRPEDAPKTNFEIRSAFAVVAVRGTKFFAGPSNDVFGVFVERGQVRVRAGNKNVTVRAGEGTSIEKPGGLPTPPKIWGKARIDAALASVELN